MAIFPSTEWVETFKEKLNSDQQYARVARNWEGDIYFIIEPGGPIKEQLVYYFDLWHGKCRQAVVVEKLDEFQPMFVLKAQYENFKGVLEGKLHPLQAMMTRKLHLQGNMSVMMRNVPTVLDFVRCAQENTDGYA